MNPRIGYRSLYHDISRYKFLYPEGEGYENWKWMDFDVELTERLGNSSGISIFACHLNQPLRAGEAFDDKLNNIFSEGLFYKDLEREEFIGSWWYRFIDKVFSDKNENRFYCANLNNDNKGIFFETREVGCFWYIIFVEKNFETKLIDLINRKNINDDRFMEDFPIKYILYRDYLNNSISVASKRQYADIIGKFVENKKIFMCDSNLRNIFDTSYIDALATKITYHDGPK